MAPVSLPCLMGTATCNFKTTELDYEHANEQLKSYMRFPHSNQGGTLHNDKNKPEKFPRPLIETDSTTEAWEDFEATWKQYKEEYNLSGRGLIRQLHDCCSVQVSTKHIQSCLSTRDSKRESVENCHCQVLLHKYRRCRSLLPR